MNLRFRISVPESHPAYKILDATEVEARPRVVLDFLKEVDRAQLAGSLNRMAGALDRIAGALEMGGVAVRPAGSEIAPGGAPHPGLANLAGHWADDDDER